MQKSTRCKYIALICRERPKHDDSSWCRTTWWFMSHIYY